MIACTVSLEINRGLSQQADYADIEIIKISSRLRFLE